MSLKPKPHRSGKTCPLDRRKTTTHRDAGFVRTVDRDVELLAALANLITAIACSCVCTCVCVCVCVCISVADVDDNGMDGRSDERTPRYVPDPPRRPSEW